MKKGRILILGNHKDSAYAMRNVFDLEPHELELALQLDVAKSILCDRRIDLIVLDPMVCLQEGFDLIDFQLDHGLRVPIVLVGGESTGVRRRFRSKGGVKVQSVPADGYKLIDFVREMESEEDLVQES